MKFNPDRIFNCLTLVLLSCMLSSVAFAQSITVGNGAGAPAGVANVSLDFVAAPANNVTIFNASFSFDDTMLTADVTNCGGAIGPATASCSAVPGAVNIVAFQLGTAPLPDGSLGSIDFTIDGGAAPGTSFPVTVTTEVYSDAAGMAVTSAGSTDGSVIVEVSGVSFYVSTPAVGDTVTFPGAVIDGVATSSATVGVSNISTDTDFMVTAVAADGVVVSDGVIVLPLTVAAGTGPNDFSFTCTPTTRGDNAGTITITNDSDNEGPDAGYPYTCPGLAPNVAVAPLTIALQNVSGLPATTATFDITNAQDGFTSDALNATLAAVNVIPEITFTALTDGTISVNETDTITVSCASAVAGNFAETINLTVDDPTGGTSVESVAVTCDVIDEVPEYASAPAVGSTITFDDVVINTGASAAMDIDVSNIDTDATPNAVLDITGVAVTPGAGTGVFTPVINTASVAIGATAPAAISVTCTTTDVGQTTATLSVTTNDTDGVVGTTASTHDYPLVCNAINEIAEYVSVPAEGSTLDFGAAVVNGVESAPIGVDIGNTQTDAIPNGVLTIASATIGGADAAVFSLVTDPTGATFTDGEVPDGVADAEVTCTPDAGSTGFTGMLTITSNDPDSPHTYPLTCGSVDNSGLVSTPAPGSTINFGEAPSGQSVEQTILVNVIPGSIDDLVISACTITGPDAGSFELVSPTVFPVTIVDGDADVAFIVSGEASVGTLIAALSCDTNDVAQATVTYDLVLTTAIAEVPTLSRFGLIALIMTLMMGGFIAFRLRQS